MINTELFLASLPIMGKGMFGIFCVIALIYVATALIGKISTLKKDDEE